MQTAPRVGGGLFSTPFDISKSFVRLREVTDGVAGLDLGRKQLVYRGILTINCINFALMSEREQDAVTEGFKGFLNGLAFPIQILIRNSPHNLDDYLRKMESVEGNLAEVARDHAHFVRILASRRALVKRHYYLIVPADHQKVGDATEALNNALSELELRMDELLQQLERTGLTGRRLTREEIVTLYQSCFSLQDDQFQPITEAMLDGSHKPMLSASERNSITGHFSRSLAETSLIEQEAALFDLIQSLPGKDEEQEDSPSLLKRILSLLGDQEEKEQSRSGLLSLLQTFLPKGIGRKAEAKWTVPKFVQISDLVTPSCIQVFPSYVRIDDDVAHEYSRTLTLVRYPRSVHVGWLDRIIQIDQAHVDFSIHIVPQPPEVVSSRLGRKLTQLRGSVLVTQREGRSPDPSTKIAMEDVENLREKLARGDERVFCINIVIRVRARDRLTLMKNSNRMVSKIRSMDFRVLPTHWQHQLGLLSCLPDVNNALTRNNLFGTRSAGTFFPFTVGDIGTGDGVMFGVQTNGAMVMLNPFNSKVLENANMVVFAKSGAGKSFFLKTVSCRLLSTCNVYVIDPEAEYQALCQQVNGQYVRLSTESLQINPFELYSAERAIEVDEALQKEEGNFFREKILNLITLLELMLSDEGTLPQLEKGFLYQCLIKTYENRGITMDPKTHNRQPPNMQEFFVILSSSLRGDDRFGVGKDTYGLSQRLERYLHLFPSRTRLSLNNRYIDFNIRELSETLKPIGLFMITEFLWTKMRQARRSNIIKSNTIILIDEAWLLMQFRQGAKFLEEFARRIRKYGGGLWCTTQNSDDFLSSDEGKTILAMSTMKFLMKQDPSTINSVVRTFNLSPKQKAFLLGARRGEGLFATKIWTQMQVIASPRETEMANTTLISQAQVQLQRAFLEQDLQRMAELNKVLDGNSTALTRTARNGIVVDPPLRKS
jgi:hypothetical protein